MKKNISNITKQVEKLNTSFNEKTFRREIADRLHTLREKKGWTTEDTAEILGVSPRTIYRHENGEDLPKYPHLIKYSYMYEVSLDYILKGEKNEINFDVLRHKFF